MKRPIGVVDFQVSALSSIFLDMNCIKGHSLGWSTSDIWLVHIIPEIVHVVGSLEAVIREEVSPEILRVCVKEVDPS